MQGLGFKPRTPPKEKICNNRTFSKKMKSGSWISEVPGIMCALAKGGRILKLTLFDEHLTNVILKERKKLILTWLSLS